MPSYPRFAITVAVVVDADISSSNPLVLISTNTSSFPSPSRSPAENASISQSFRTSQLIDSFHRCMPSSPFFAITFSIVVFVVALYSLISTSTSSFPSPSRSPTGSADIEDSVPLTDSAHRCSPSYPRFAITVAVSIPVVSSYLRVNTSTSSFSSPSKSPAGHAYTQFAPSCDSFHNCVTFPVNRK